MYLKLRAIRPHTLAVPALALTPTRSLLMSVTPPPNISIYICILTDLHVCRQRQSRRARTLKKRPSPLLPHTQERQWDSLLTSLAEESVIEAGFRLGFGWV